MSLCDNCFKPFFEGIKRCSQCKSRHFCCKECQKADWKTHKKICKKINEKCFIHRENIYECVNSLLHVIDKNESVLQYCAYNALDLSEMVEKKEIIIVEEGDYSYLGSDQLNENIIYIELNKTDMILEQLLEVWKYKIGRSYEYKEIKDTILILEKLHNSLDTSNLKGWTDYLEKFNKFTLKIEESSINYLE